LNTVVFKKAAEQGLLKKYRSLFPGLGFAAGYKISQRIYKFGGQPAVNDFLNKNYKKDFERIFGDRQAKTWMHATAGSIIGIGEIALLPLDVLKIKMQTNAAQFEKQSFMQIVKSEGWGLYRGASWTAARVFFFIKFHRMHLDLLHFLEHQLQSKSTVLDLKTFEKQRFLKTLWHP
jgi:hypothetical protein